MPVSCKLALRFRRSAPAYPGQNHRVDGYDQHEHIDTGLPSTANLYRHDGNRRGIPQRTITTISSAIVAVS